MSARFERANAKGDAVGAGMGLLASLAYTTALKSHIGKHKPTIAALLPKNNGVLLAISTSKAGNEHASQMMVEWVALAGAGKYPESLAYEFVKRGSLSPAAKGAPQELIFLWVMNRAKMDTYFKRPPGMYASVKQSIKVAAFEDL